MPRFSLRTLIVVTLLGGWVAQLMSNDASDLCATGAPPVGSGKECP
jgi:hypothetical protein